MPMSLTLEDALNGVAFLEPHVRLLPARPPPGGAPHGAALGPLHHGADVDHGDVEQRLDGGLDVVLAGFGVRLEGVFLARGVRGRRFLGHHRPHHDAIEHRHHFPPFFLGAGRWAGFRAAALGRAAPLAARSARLARAVPALAEPAITCPPTAGSSTTTASAQRTSYADACW